LTPRPTLSNHEYLDQEGHATDLFAEEALGWRKRTRDKPWFIQVALTAVNIPLQEPSNSSKQDPEMLEQLKSMLSKLARDDKPLK
jgi:hypothetical protein